MGDISTVNRVFKPTDIKGGGTTLYWMGCCSLPLPRWHDPSWWFALLILCHVDFEAFLVRSWFMELSNTPYTKIDGWWFVSICLTSFFRQKLGIYLSQLCRGVETTNLIRSFDNPHSTFFRALQELWFDTSGYLWRMWAAEVLLIHTIW